MTTIKPEHILFKTDNALNLVKTRLKSLDLDAYHMNISIIYI